jgi:hypothetical protein
MIPLSEVISRVRTKFEASSTTRWSDARIQEFVNDGLESLAEAGSWYERYVTVPEQPLRTWYDLRGFTPETVSHIKSIWSTSRNEWLTPVTEDELDPQWEDATGTPQVFFTRGIYWLGVYPRLGESDTAGYLRVYFTGVPQRFSYTQAVLRDLPDDYVPALEDYALYEMSLLDREPKKAIMHWQSYLKREKSLHDFADRRLEGGSAIKMGGLL